MSSGRLSRCPTQSWRDLILIAFLLGLISTELCCLLHNAMACAATVHHDICSAFPNGLSATAAAERPLGEMGAEYCIPQTL